MAVPGIASLLYFNVASGLPNTVSENDPNRYVLPDNASVIGALLTNNGTPIVTTAQIGFGIAPFAYATTLPPDGQLSAIIRNLDLVNINSAGGLTVGFIAALGSTGATVPTLSVVIAPTKPLSIAINLAPFVGGTQPSITNGDLALILTYIIE